MKKPHIVKKCASPGIDQRSIRVCPNTSLIWVPMRSPMWSVRPFSSPTGWPARTSLYSHSTRLQGESSDDDGHRETDDEPDQRLGIHPCLPIPKLPDE